MPVKSRRRTATPVSDKHENAEPPNLPAHDLFLNRELTWLSYNERILAEAAHADNPLLERVRFLAVASANLDSFFMKRIGGLKQQVCAGVRELSADGMLPREQLNACRIKIDSFELLRERVWNELYDQLGRQKVRIIKFGSLTAPVKAELRKRFRETIYPLITPQSIDPAHPFPFISNMSLNLLVSLRYHSHDETVLARVKIPVAPDTPRLVGCGGGTTFVLLEDLVIANLDLLFPGMKVVDWAVFRIIRNANSVKNEDEADDLMAVIETELKERRFAPIVRLEVASGISSLMKGRLAAELEIDEQADVFETSAMLGMNDLKELLALEIPEALFPQHYPVDHPQLEGQCIFQSIRQAGSILLQHPFQSFSGSVERLLKEAAVDPNVRAIKMTLYRTVRESACIEALLEAARNGKQVAVVVELKARFDEAENIRLAEMMNDAGIHVSYGVMEYKTYCKAIMIVRQDPDGLKRYVHIGTGNYHPTNSRFYCDLGLLMVDDDAIGQDVTELFNYLTTGLNPRRKYRKLLVAPHRLKRTLLKMIRQEGELHACSGGGLIRMKMNALEDPDVVRALYNASCQGVRIELIIRDSCRIRPGIKELSENISVISIVGRFVEHSRIYHFRNGGKDQYFIGSADAMKRNMETRVEILCPIESPKLQRELDVLFDAYFNDQVTTWDMDAAGIYVKRRRVEDSNCLQCQETLGLLAQKRGASLRRSKNKKHLEALEKQ